MNYRIVILLTVILLVFLFPFFGCVQTQDHREPLTKLEFPGSKTKITLPKVNKSLPPPPYVPYDIVPEPEVEFSHVKKELVHYSAKFTFFPAEPLKPGTKYRVTVIAGQEKPPSPNSSPYLKKSWNFTTKT